MIFDGRGKDGDKGLVFDVDGKFIPYTLVGRTDTGDVLVKLCNKEGCVLTDIHGRSLKELRRYKFPLRFVPMSGLQLQMNASLYYQAPHDFARPVQVIKRYYHKLDLKDLKVD